MGKIVIFALLVFVSCLVWCDKTHNFMDVDNPNAKDDLKYYIWSWSGSKINGDDLVPDSLSWVRKDTKWYANEYYEDNLKEYVDVAKEWLSWAVQELKWYYNSWVDELKWVITNKTSEAISWEMNKFKIK